jgi:predicted  nucleic acid-binding Zn-ribbon protein
MPGTYQVTLARQDGDAWKQLAGPMSFKVVRLRENSIPSPAEADRLAFAKTFEQSRAKYSALMERFSELKKDVAKAQEAILRSERADIAEALQSARRMSTTIDSLDLMLDGPSSKTTIGEKVNPTLSSRLWETRRGYSPGYGATGTSEQNLKLFTQEVKAFEMQVSALEQELKELREQTANWKMPRY